MCVCAFLDIFVNHDTYCYTRIVTLKSDQEKTDVVTKKKRNFVLENVTYETPIEKCHEL